MTSRSFFLLLLENECWGVYMYTAMQPGFYAQKRYRQDDATVRRLDTPVMGQGWVLTRGIWAVYCLGFGL